MRRGWASSITCRCCGNGDGHIPRSTLHRAMGGTGTTDVVVLLRQTGRRRIRGRIDGLRLCGDYALNRATEDVMGYELGLVVNGRAVVLWQSADFPPYGVHDMLYRTAKAITEMFPDAVIRSFQTHDGHPYSC